MDEVELMIFDVFYDEVDSELSYGDYMRVRAEDEEHAKEKFVRSFPHLQIREVECRGYAF